MDLTTKYLGRQLKNPLVAAASPLSRELDSVRRLEDAGIAAIVMYSLFEEQIEHELDEHEHYEQFSTYAHAEALTHRPGLDYTPRGPQEYVEHLGQAKKAVDIPVIASLNGTTVGGWVEHARLLQEAGADALELNIYHVATDPQVTAQGVEDRYVDILQAVKEQVQIPVAVKLGPQFTSLANFATRLDECGADALILFNRFYQPDIDLETLQITPDLVLSAPHEMRLILRWIAILDPLVKADLAATTGIYDADTVVKLLMAGADVTMLCAALLREGPDAATKILNDMRSWMEEHEYDSVEQMQGSMNHATSGDPSGFERANYMKALQSYA